ncbi:MAG: ParB/RepB/Spo0J family partition protein [Flavobacteriales bacterium]|nr:ParB/RepB/Spo0J family partition protein [Flavobacteriales bacterium]
MGKERGALGRGLASILGTNITDISSNSKVESQTITAENLGKFHEVNLSHITTNPFQPRTDFNVEKLNELATSIENLGVIQPITVRKMKEQQYQLISGERRFRASQLAGLTKIPAFIRIANDQQMLEMALVENIQRENLNPIEVALSYKRLIDEINLTQEECSERVGKNRSTISNFLRLLKLPNEIQKALINGKISNGHARSLVSIKSEESQINLFYDIIENGYSVREVEQLSKEFSSKTYKQISKVKPPKYTVPFKYQKIIHDLSKKTNTSLELKYNENGKGKLIIPFSNDKGLTDLINLLNK